MYNLFLVLAVGCAISFVPEGVHADVVRNACMSSKAKSKSVRLCSCIQAAADASLSNSEQKLTAKMIKDPELSQDVKASNSWRNERFWKRYTTFSQLAQKYCS